MPKYSIETQIEIEIDGDEEEALQHADNTLQRAHDRDMTSHVGPEWHYPEQDSDEPIDGTQIRVSTWPDEATADAEANRLQADCLTSIA